MGNRILVNFISGLWIQSRVRGSFVDETCYRAPANVLVVPFAQLEFPTKAPVTRYRRWCCVAYAVFYWSRACSQRPPSTSSVMMSCGDDALPLATNHWPMMTKVDRKGPSLPAVTVIAPEARYAECENAAHAGGDTMAVLRQRLEMYWSQVLLYQQQCAAGLRVVGESKPTVQSCVPPNGDAQEVLDEARSVVQRLLADKTNSYAGPMPLSGLVAIAANRQIGQEASADRVRKSGARSEMGNLLPPPPLVSMTSPSSSPPQHCVSSASSVTASTVQFTTSTFPLDLTKDIEEPASSAVKNGSSAPCDESLSANQPLDLSAPKKWPAFGKVPSKVRLRSDEEHKPYTAAAALSKVPTSPVNSSSSYQHPIFAAPAFAGLTQQQISALAPYLQSPKSDAFSSPVYSQNGQAVSTAPLATEYLHRWISAAQQRQQTVHAHPPKKRRKIVSHRAFLLCYFSNFDLRQLLRIILCAASLERAKGNYRGLCLLNRNRIERFRSYEQVE